MKPGISDFQTIMETTLDTFVQIYGLQHIAIKVASYLDYQSLANCQLLSTTWNRFIQETEMIWRHQVRNLKFGTIKNHFKFKRSRGTTTYLETNENIPFLSKFPD